MPLSFGVTVLPDPPHSRFVELLQLAEEQGFDWGWTYDSHILWQESIPLLTLAALNTSKLKLGHCVTNPGTRDPTVLASAYATMHDLSDGRMFMGIGRGDSARRVIGLDPVKIAEFERSLVMIRDLMNGRTVEWNGKELELTWAKGRPEIPMYVAGYGPKALGVAGRVGDGVVIQLADPDIIEWIMGIARRAAEESGRDPGGAPADRVRAGVHRRRPRRRARAGALVPGDGLEPRHGSAAEVPRVGAAARALRVRQAPHASTTTRTTAASAPSTASSSTTRPATASASSGRPRITSPSSSSSRRSASRTGTST